MSDLISRADAIEAIDKQWLHGVNVPICEEIRTAIVQIISALPSADTDMSEYCDRLWKIAYERGKAEDEQHKKGAKNEILCRK